MTALSNGQEPAYPLTVPRDQFSVDGLTKRELFAAMAMQGLCADRHHEDTQGVSSYIATKSAECADALLAELAKPVAEVVL